MNIIKRSLISQSRRFLNTMVTPTPPQPAMGWKITAKEILDKTNKAIADNKAIDDEIAAESNPTFENVILKYAKQENHEQSIVGPLTFYQRVSTDKDLREASTKAEELLENYYIDAGTREDVYEKVKHVWDNLPENLDAESKRLAKKIETKYRRNGLGLPKEKREKVVELQKQLSNTCIEFNKNLDAEAGYLLFTKEELEGIPDRAYEIYEQVDGKYKVTFKYPHIDPVLKYAKSGATRKRLFVAYENKNTDNNKLMTKAVELRAEIAQLLGYDTHSDYVLEERMAKKPETVLSFLKDLRSKLTEKGKEEVNEMLKLKNQELQERGLSQEDTLYMWDLKYYDNLKLEREYKVDSEKISEYFPMEQTITGMLQLFEKIFSLEFHEVSGEGKDVWHEDVRQYSVWKTESGKPEFVGWFYLDLHPRDNKYSHAANFGLSQGYWEGSKRAFPVTALVCNFTKPTETRPSLLKHSEVTTFFHELGHGIHDLIGESTYSRFHGTSVEWDFVEAPSQMLEYWTWNKQQLKDISGHYENPSEKLSDELIDSLIRSKHVNGAIFNLRQLHFGLFDMTLHTAKSVEEAKKIDICALWNDLRQEVSHVSQGDEQRVHGYSSFGHLMGGYSSGYYGYMWSQVFASDMYYTKFKADPVDTKVGMEYRTKVIGRGGTRDSMDNLVDFLGREPTSDAFLQELGISEQKANL